MLLGEFGNTRNHRANQTHKGIERRQQNTANVDASFLDSVTHQNQIVSRSFTTVFKFLLHGPGVLCFVGSDDQILFYQIQRIQQRRYGRQRFLAKNFLHDGKLLVLRQLFYFFQHTNYCRRPIFLHALGQFHSADAQRGKCLFLRFCSSRTGGHGQNEIFDARGCHFGSNLHRIKRGGQGCHGLCGHATNIAKRPYTPHDVGNTLFRCRAGIGELVHQIQHGPYLRHGHAHGRAVTANGLCRFFCAHAKGHTHMRGHLRKFLQISHAIHALLPTSGKQGRQLRMGQRQSTTHLLNGRLHLIVFGGQVTGAVAHSINGFGRIGHARFKIYCQLDWCTYGQGWRDSFNQPSPQFPSFFGSCFLIAIPLHGRIGLGQLLGRLGVG